MANPFTALEAMKAHLLNLMDPTPEPRPEASQILLEPPDVDRMKHTAMIYLVLKTGTADVQTYQSETDTYRGSAYIIVKASSSHSSMEALIQATLEYMAAFRNAIVTDPTLGGAVLRAEIGQWDFYPAVEGLTNAAGIEVDFSLFTETA